MLNSHLWFIRKTIKIFVINKRKRKQPQQQQQTAPKNQHKMSSLQENNSTVPLDDVVNKRKAVFSRSDSFDKFHYTAFYALQLAGKHAFNINSIWLLFFMFRIFYNILRDKFCVKFLWAFVCVDANGVYVCVFMISLFMWICLQHNKHTHRHCQFRENSPKTTEKNRNEN